MTQGQWTKRRGRRGKKTAVEEDNARKDREGEDNDIGKVDSMGSR